jgi:putative ABC transport system permease protein
VTRAARNLEPKVGISAIGTMDGVVAQATAGRRFALSLVGLFAVVALLLTSSGLYGVISAGVIERTREIGLRAALGAPRDRILRLIVRQGLALTVAGLVIGSAGALMLGGVLRAFLFGVSPTDPLTFAAVGAGLGLVAVLACSLPAWRASRVDPAIALRAE